MKKTIAAAVIAAAGFIGFGLVFSGPANAQPAFCDNHGGGPGQIYIHACAGGGGNGGSTMWIKDPVTGLPTQVDQQDVFTDSDTNSP